MKHLSTIGRITTPAAMVVFMAYAITDSQEVSGWWVHAVLAGAVFTAVGVEVVGILSGHVLEGYWKLRDIPRSLLAFVLLIVYTAAAIYILKDNAALLPVPIIAAVVYIVSALADSMDGQQTAVQRQQDTRQAFDLEQEATEREHKRRLEAAGLRLKHEVKLAQIQAKSANPTPQIIAENAATAQLASLYECACGQVYEKSQSYSAHARHCEIYKRVTANGHG